jgi:hypothetical protein
MIFKSITAGDVLGLLISTTTLGEAGSNSGVIVW